MQQYLNLLNKILTEGVEKKNGRANMPNTIGISKADISMDLSKGFPLLTTKKMYWKGIVHELLWFLRGETNIKYLVDNNVHIWDGDAYRWYLKWWDEYGKDIGGISKIETKENFIKIIKKTPYLTQKYWKDTYTTSSYVYGDLGKVYGYQWRNQNGVDQLKDVIDGLKNNPYSRYHIIDAWNKADFPDMALPPCHLLYQFTVRPQKDLSKFYLDLNMYQRSADVPLGVPFNLASMSLLLMIISKATNMIPGVANWIGGDTHIYVNQIENVKEQLKRTPYELPQMIIKKDINTLEDIENLTIDDFELLNYKSHPKIKYILSVGLK